MTIANRRAREERLAEVPRALESLCAAVILQALKDSQMSPSRIRAQDQAEAIRFLDGEAGALEECASIIGIDASTIRSRWRGGW